MRNLLLFTGCLLLPAASATAKEAAHGKKDHGAVHWGYEGKEGPAQWGKLSQKFAICGAGKRQSPMDLQGGTAKDWYGLAPHWLPATIRLTNNGHTVQQAIRPGSGITVGGRTFHLLQFHMHTPSEHTVNGKPFPLEIHFVHASEVGELLVIGVLVKEGAAHPTLQKIVDYLPMHAEHEVVAADIFFNPSDLLPKDRAYYHYPGSLTTPPCSEGVNWFVLQQPITASAHQLERLESLMGHNARPVQPANERLLILGP